MGNMRKIALEEHFTGLGFEEYAEGFLKNIDAAERRILVEKLSDFQGMRLQEMDRGGIDLAVLSQSGPGVQAEPDTVTAVKRAKENNDFLAERVAINPDRFAGFAHLPMQSPEAAAKELERSVRTLGFKGSLVNGHTLGVYYDDPAYDAFWEVMQDLDVPLYLHPVSPYRTPYVLEGHPELFGATWGWGVETGSHALRLLFGGVFDRFPRLKIIIGHMGEGLPFLRWRFDSRFAVYPMGVTLKHKPSEYFGKNIFITTAGVCSQPSLIGAIGEMGTDAVMFSIDYPYESTSVAAEFIDGTDLTTEVKTKVCSANAERLLGL